MIFLRSLAFNLLFFGSSAVILTAALPALILPRRVVVAVGDFWCRLVLGTLRLTCGITHEIRGLEHLPREACIIASKHQSAWDTLIFSGIIRDRSFVVKRELMWIPVYGWLLNKAGMVPIDRAAGAKALRGMIRVARAKLAQERSIIVFPEGTRMAPGAHRPYLPGVAALYTQLGVPVVPVALNSGLYWGRRAFVKRPGRITLEILPPIAPGLTRKDFMRELTDRIETASDRLCAANDA